MRKYETTFAIDSLQKSENMQNILTKVQNFIKNNGGEIGEVEDWGKKRLAYEINRKQYGNYYQIHFEGPSGLPGLLEREYRLEESILRFLTLISDPKAALKREESVEPAKEAEATKATAVEATDTKEATAVEATDTKEATAVEATDTKEATAVEAKDTKEAAEVEAAETKEAAEVEAAETKEAAEVEATETEVVPEDAKMEDKSGEDDSSKEETVADVKEEVKETDETKE